MITLRSREYLKKVAVFTTPLVFAWSQTAVIQAPQSVYVNALTPDDRDCETEAHTAGSEIQVYDYIMRYRLRFYRRPIIAQFMVSLGKILIWIVFLFGQKSRGLAWGCSELGGHPSIVEP